MAAAAVVGWHALKARQSEDDRFAWARSHGDRLRFLYWLERFVERPSSGRRQLG